MTATSGSADSPSGARRMRSLSTERHTVTRTRKLKKPIAQDEKPSVPISAERPIGDDKANRQEPSKSAAPDAEKERTLSIGMEFSLRIGSLVEARKSIIRGYLLLVLVPTVLLLAIISWLSGQNADGTASLIRSMDYMLTVIAVMGLPVLVVSWVNGLYPKGSYGRFVSSMTFASVLVVWLTLLLLESNLRNAFADLEIVLQLDRVLVLVCVAAIFSFGQAVSELLDNRKTWRKSIGAEVKIAPLNLNSEFLDFDPRIGKLARGNTFAVSAYVQLLVVPTLLLVLADWLIEEMDLVAKDAITTSVGTMFGSVLLFGIVLVLIHLVRGFYPSGSFGHATAGLVRVPILFLFAWEILVGSGIQEAFAQNYFLIDMYDVMLPVVMYVAFITVFELSELADCRRSWHKEIGMQVEPYLPEEDYGVQDDFRLRYMAFEGGAKKGRKVLNRYALRRILVFTIAGAIVVSLLEYAGGMIQYSTVQEMIDHVESAFVSWLDQWIHTLLIISILLTSAYFLAWSYRAGSFSRLVLTWLVSVLNALWAYYLWGGAARSTNVSPLAMAFNIVMLAFIALAGVMAAMAFRVYTNQRKAYLNWRTLMLDEEAAFAKRRLTAGTPAPTSTSPEPLPFGMPGLSADPKRSTFFFEGIPAHTSVFSVGSYSFDVATADQSGSRISRQDVAILTAVKSSDGPPEGNMASYMAITRMPASKVIKRATEHFGALSGGLMVKSKTDTSLCLECSKGFVTITVSPSKSRGSKNEVGIETSQYDRQVKEFLSLI